MTKPIWFFYGGFLTCVMLSLLRRKPFGFMTAATRALNVSAAPVGLALAITATDKALLGLVVETSGFELYIGLVAMLVLSMALKSLFDR